MILGRVGFSIFLNRVGRNIFIVKLALLDIELGQHRVNSGRVLEQV